MITSDFPKVEVIRVVDGDTFVAVIPGMPKIFSAMSIRVKGIDTPEMKAERQCERDDARAAKIAAAAVLLNAKVDLKFCESDKYFRLACFVYAGNIDLSQRMLTLDLATPYGGGTKIKWNCKK